MNAAREALQCLRDGNRRFVASLKSGADGSVVRRNKLAEIQEPLAIVLGCSDARVPAEIVFDQGIGDLFVIRVAGNIVAPSQVGSVEFAAKQFGTQLVVVLGHSQCGAVQATLQELERPSASRSPNLRSIVEQITPALQTLIESETHVDRETLFRRAVRANCRASAHHLRHGSKILEELIGAGQLLVVGAEYSIETGNVDFFDGMEPTA